MFAFIPVMTEMAQKDEEDRLLAALIQQDREDRYEYKILHGGIPCVPKTGTNATDPR